MGMGMPSWDGRALVGGGVFSKQRTGSCGRGSCVLQTGGVSLRKVARFREGAGSSGSRCVTVLGKLVSQ